MTNDGITKGNNKKYVTIILPVLLVLLDYVVVVAAEQCAFTLRNSFFRSSRLHISWLNFWFTFPVIYLFFINMKQLYSRRRPFYKEVEQVFYSCVYGTLGVIFVLYAARIAAHTSRFFTLVFGVLAFLFLLLERYGLKTYLQRNQLMQIPVVIIGAGKTAELLARAIGSDAGLGYKIIGLLEDHKVQSGVLEKYPVLGGFEDAERVIKETGVLLCCCGTT